MPCVKGTSEAASLTQVVPESAGLPVVLIVVVGHQFESHAGIILRAGHSPVHLNLLPEKTTDRRTSTKLHELKNKLNARETPRNSSREFFLATVLLPLH
jgi:hypothetical protein